MFFVLKISTLLNCWGESGIFTTLQPEFNPVTQVAFYVFSIVVQLLLASPYPGDSLLPCAFCRAGPSWFCARLHEYSSSFLSNSIVIQWQTGAAMPREVKQKILPHTGKKDNTCAAVKGELKWLVELLLVLLKISLSLKFRTSSLRLFNKSCCSLDTLALI